jgi:heme-degrading monooxygenase HmoA
MIVRLWRGVVPTAKAAEYIEYQKQVGPPGYREIPGNLGVYVLGRDLGETYEVSMLTFWDSWESIRAFAGDPVDRAKYYEHDFEYLIEAPETVEHFEVLEAVPTGTDLPAPSSGSDAESP